MVNPSHHTLSTIARMTPSLPQRGRQPKGASPPLTPNFDLFFRCVFTAMLHGARVDRPRAPVAPSLSNTLPYRFSTEPDISQNKKCSQNVVQESRFRENTSTIW